VVGMSWELLVVDLPMLQDPMIAGHRRSIASPDAAVPAAGSAEGRAAENEWQHLLHLSSDSCKGIRGRSMISYGCGLKRREPGVMDPPHQPCCWPPVAPPYPGQYCCCCAA
jgi:hypothetical protein